MIEGRIFLMNNLETFSLPFSFFCFFFWFLSFFFLFFFFLLFKPTILLRIHIENSHDERSTGSHPFYDLTSVRGGLPDYVETREEQCDRRLNTRDIRLFRLLPRGIGKYAKFWNYSNVQSPMNRMAARLIDFIGPVKFIFVVVYSKYVLIPLYFFIA